MLATGLLKICESDETYMIGLPYIQKQNYWQSQWLLFATTNKL